MRNIIFFTVLLGLVVFAVPAYAPPIAKDVNVINEPTVHVGSSVEVNAYQAGEWTVNVETAAKAMKEFTGNLEVADGWVQVYQVPSGKRFVLTDIYFNQRIYGAWINTISLNRNTSDYDCGIGSNHVMITHILGLDGSERNQVFFPLQTGYEFVAGERICIAQSGGGLIFYNLSGYETDL